MKRIIICADGTWNRPEKNVDDQASNVLRLARAVKPIDENGVSQQVFYDWGIGSYYNSVIGGATGSGIEKNIMDDYRYIVQNYSEGDELYFFGFSRGAYTVRSLCGLIYNCGILKRPNAGLIQRAFEHYKNPGKKYKPSGKESIKFRNDYSHSSRDIKFVGVWDTVGALGIPFSFLGLFKRKDEFYDNRMGSNIKIARHALAIDELRSDFEPTIWKNRDHLDLKQVWFMGAHCDVGGSYKPDKNTQKLLSDIPLGWMIREAETANLAIESHLEGSLKPSSNATIHNSRIFIYRSKSPYYRPIDHGVGDILIHKSVKERWDSDRNYRPRNLVKYVEQFSDDNWTCLVD